MDNILNTNAFDPFKDVEDLYNDVVVNNTIHLRLQQRNGRKCITIVEGLLDSEELPLKTLVKSLRKSFNCSAAIVDDKENKDQKVIQLSGDKRKNIADYLVKKKIVDKTHIKIHGY